MITREEIERRTRFWCIVTMSNWYPVVRVKSAVPSWDPIRWGIKWPILVVEYPCKGDEMEFFRVWPFGGLLNIYGNLRYKIRSLRGN